MTYQERDEIFSKEALHISDFEKLFGMKYSTATQFLRNLKIKREIQGRPLRLNIEGYIHTADYLEEMGFDPTAPGDRYCKKKEKSERDRFLEKTETMRRSVCV